MNIIVDLLNDIASASSDHCWSAHIQTQCQLSNYDSLNELFKWIYSKERK